MNGDTQVQMATMCEWRGKKVRRRGRSPVASRVRVVTRCRLGCSELTMQVVRDSISPFESLRVGPSFGLEFGARVGTAVANNRRPRDRLCGSAVSGMIGGEEWKVAVGKWSHHIFQRCRWSVAFADRHVVRPAASAAAAQRRRPGGRLAATAALAASAAAAGTVAVVRTVGADSRSSFNTGRGCCGSRCRSITTLVGRHIAEATAFKF